MFNLFYNNLMSISNVEYNVGIAYYNDKHYEKAFKFLKLAADKGHMKAQCYLASLYYNGYGCEKNLQLAFNYYKLLADQGDDNAQLNLAYMYFNGEACEKNLKEGLKYYKLSAEQGNISSLYTLGQIYDEGKALKKNMREAIKYYKLAAEKGCMQSIGLLMNAYSFGYEKNPNEAFKYCKLLVEKGSPWAQYDFSQMYYNGKGCEKNLREAFKYCKLSADKEDIRALYHIAHMYFYGEGCEKNLEEAFKYIKLSAEQHHTGAYLDIANMYYNGIGCEKNIEKAYNYYILAAKYGYKYPYYKIGDMYENGIYVQKNIEIAIKCYNLGADKNESNSQLALAKLYENGKGVEKNIDEALRLYDLVSIDHNFDVSNDIKRLIEMKEPKPKVIKQVIKELENPNLKFSNNIIINKEPENIYDDDKINKIKEFIIIYNKLLTSFFKEDITKIKYTEHSDIIHKIVEFMDKLSSDYSIFNAEIIIDKLKHTLTFLQSLVIKSCEKTINEAIECNELLRKKYQDFDKLKKMILINIMEEDSIGWNDKKIKICDFTKFIKYINENIPKNFMKINIANGVIIKNHKFSSVHLTISQDILKKGRFHITSEKLNKRIYFTVKINEITNEKNIQCFNDDRNITDIFQEYYIIEEINEDIVKDINELVEYVKQITEIKDFDIVKSVE